MMYKKDQHGEYAETHRWIEAWDAGPGGNYVPGWTICELREYEDGTHRVHRAKTVYLHEIPDAGLRAMHAVFIVASNTLLRSCRHEKRIL